MKKNLRIEDRKNSFIGRHYDMNFTNFVIHSKCFVYRTSRENPMDTKMNDYFIPG